MWMSNTSVSPGTGGAAWKVSSQPSSRYTRSPRLSRSTPIQLINSRSAWPPPDLIDIPAVHRDIGLCPHGPRAKPPLLGLDRGDAVDKQHGWLGQPHLPAEPVLRAEERPEHRGDPATGERFKRGPVKQR